MFTEIALKIKARKRIKLEMRRKSSFRFYSRYEHYQIRTLYEQIGQR
jgi:hypothetical protein